MEIEFITEDTIAAKHFSVEPIKNNLPEWYKNLPVILEQPSIEYFIKSNNPFILKTIRGCTPVLDYLTSGYVIKANQTILLKNYLIDKNVEDIKYFTTKKNSVSFHSHEQCPIKINDMNKVYIKLNCDWKIKTPKGYSCLLYQPYYSNIEKKYDLFPAIVDTDVYDAVINFSGWIQNYYKEIKIEPGDHVMCVFPFKREKWNMKISIQKESQSSMIHRFLNNAYKKCFWHKKNYE